MLKNCVRDETIRIILRRRIYICFIIFLHIKITFARCYFALVPEKYVNEYILTVRSDNLCNINMSRKMEIANVCVCMSRINSETTEPILNFVGSTCALKSNLGYRLHLNFQFIFDILKFYKISMHFDS